MPFKVSDFHDLVELLETHPQWRAELRRLILTDDVLVLPRAVQELVESQKRTDQQLQELAASVRELTAAQKRTEQRLTRLEAVVQELAEAQKRTEQRVEELAEAQKRTEQRVERLAEEQQETRRQLARLSDRIGVSIEEEAADVLRTVLETRGYRVVGKDYALAVNGEIDVVLPLEDEQGHPVWAVLEAKVRLSRRAVEAWAKRMRDPNFQDALRAEGVSGPYLVYAYGMRLDLGVREAAREFGIGLVSSRGEEVSPAPLNA